MNFSRILRDPSMGGTTFTVHRDFFRKEMGEDRSDHSETFTVSGCIQSASPEDLKLFPEETRTEDIIVILSGFGFSLGHRETRDRLMTSPDEIEWNNARYRVIRTRNFSREGGFHKAWAVRLK